MIMIDRNAGTLTLDGTTLPLESAEAFRILSDAWIDAAMRVKHQYTFTWLGRPVIQFADDLLRLQEIVYRVQPDVIVETGVAHGGSLVFHASLCKLLGRGRVIGIDIEIRPQNRVAIEAHPLAPLITLFEGSSIDPAIVSAVKGAIAPGETVLVVLDSNHTKAHVRAELDAYSQLVAPGSYVVAMDGHVMETAANAPRAAADWATNNPNAAVREFANEHPEFIHEEPRFLFNESGLTEAITGFYGGVLKRIR
ncbi:MAG TPA: CmcI family methyltransferase [Thermoanaerobaculia bacterium]|jgi:cephalosporin hydroxylase|nr:CmcI family methyltransferase [Thermoanaerobaculia bacterium]